MAVEIASAYVTLIPSAKGMKENIGKELAGAGPVSEQAGKDAGKKFTGGFKGMAAKAGGLFAAAGVGLFVKDAIAAASDVAESTSKVGVVFGKSSDQIIAASKGSAKAMGLSSGAYLEATGTLGNLLVALDIAPPAAAKMSQEMVKLAGDLASFNNVSPEEALDAIRSGLVGETEPLKRFGVNMNEATLKAQAMKMGLIKTTNEALNPQQKALAAHALIMEQTKTAQGDFARTSDGLANRQRILAAQFEDVKAKVGQALLPAMTAFVGFLSNTAIPAVTSLGQFLGENKTVILALAGAVGGLWAAYKGYKILSSVMSSVKLLGARYSQFVAQLSYGNRVQRATSSGLQSVTGSTARMAGAMTFATAAVAIGAYAWEQHQQEVAAAKALVEDMTNAIQADNGALGDNTKALIANKLASSGAYDAGIKLGLSIDTLTAAASGNKDAMTQVAKATNGNFEAINKVLNPIAGLAESQQKARHNIEQTTKAMDGAKGATNALGETTQGTTGAVKDQTQAVDDMRRKQAEATQQMRLANDAAGLLSQAFDRLNGKTIDVTDADISFRSTLSTVISSMKENGRTTSLATEAGRKNTEAINAAIRAAQAHGEAVGKASNSTMRGTQATLADLQALRKRVVELGGNTSAIDAMIRSIKNVPAGRTTKFDVDTATAKRKAQTLKDIIDSIPTQKWLTVNLNTRGNAKASDLADLRRAHGGWITGPGGPTSDSRLVAASPGEFVVNAASAAKYGDLLEWINSGRMPRAAVTADPRAGGGGGGNTYNLYAYDIDQAVRELSRRERLDQARRFA